MVALSVVGSAILLFSCEREEEPESESRIEMMMTEYSENLSVVMSQNGRRSYHFKTPLLEGYSLAREPYREFPKGVETVSYTHLFILDQKARGMPRGCPCGRWVCSAGTRAPSGRG